MNYFEIDKEFFIIDSCDLSMIDSHLYGFCVQKRGLIENDSLLSLDEDDMGCGAYIYVKREGNTISILQDYNGSYGLFLYQNENEFIISNSFFYLVDYLKNKLELTLNMDFARYMMLMELCSHSHNATLINEITLLPKNIKVKIDCVSRSLALENCDYLENQIEIDSAEGVGVLDQWFSKWKSIIRGVYNECGELQIALSGGIDSRISFLIALQSGIDLRKVYVKSITDGLHTHSEDYEIASLIAEHYGFKLNMNHFSDNDAVNYSLEDVLNICIYNKIAFHKEMYYQNRKYKKKRFFVQGYGGEAIRAHWDVSAEELTGQYLRRAQRYGTNFEGDFCNAVKRVERDTYSWIRKKYNIQSDDANELTMYLYRETRNRNHFGRASVDSFFANSFILAPLMDPILMKLKLYSSCCADKNLLIAVLFDRYCKDLLQFKFEGNREIAYETIEEAKRINQRYPFSDCDDYFKEEYTFSLCKSNHIDISDSLNCLIPDDAPDKFVKNVFDQIEFRRFFDRYFGDAVYQYADKYAHKAKFHPLKECYPFIGIYLAGRSVELSRDNLNTPFSMLRQVHEAAPEFNYLKLLEQIRDNITARIDILLKGDENAMFEIVSCSDPFINDYLPTWIQKLGYGHVLESNAMQLRLKIRFASAGDLRLSFRARDVKNAIGKRIVQWIDYKQIIVSNESLLEAATPASHDNPIVLSKKIEKNEILDVFLEWEIHKDNHAENFINADSKVDLSTMVPKEQYDELEKKYADIISSKPYIIGHGIMHIPTLLMRTIKRVIRR